jgi:hypothetical protein
MLLQQTNRSDRFCWRANPFRITTNHRGEPPVKENILSVSGTVSKKTVATFMLALFTVLLGGCASTEYNETVFPYQINNEILATKKPKKLILATVNFSGEPTRSYLDNAARRIDVQVKDYLRSAGYELADDYLFDNAWNQALRSYGSIYDPTTGRVDVEGWRVVIIATAKALQKEGIDAVVFSDVLEDTVQHDRTMNHYAKWNGVTRKPATQGTGDGVPMDFNWGERIKAATLAINIYSVDLKGLFKSQAGIDTLQAVDLKMSNPGWVRRKKILEDSDHIEEAIRLAFHPFIPINNYPELKK